MTQLFLLIFIQVVIATLVIVVLKRLLDRELQQAAIEKFFSLKPSNNISVINIYYAHQLSGEIRSKLESFGKDRFLNSKIIFEQNNVIKGGLVIALGDEVLDFSMANRLENFWS